MSSSESFEYQGSELEAAAHAVNWKRYFGSAIAPWLRGRVLEVGAGIGGTTTALRTARQTEWTCLEPDARLAADLSKTVLTDPPAPTRVFVGDLSALPPDDRFDAILYIDVLEHIEDDRGELRRAEAHLAPGGAIVVLCPAFQYLFSEMDHALGHFRRYDAKTLSAVFPPSLRRRRVFYLDALGVIASLTNKFFLRQQAPSTDQIRFFDSVIIPISRRVLDPIVLRSFGRSVVAIYDRPA